MAIFESFMTGMQAGQQQRDRQTRAQAGSMMASGDYAGASRALYQAGDFQGGNAIAGQGRAQQMVPLLRDGNYDQAMQIPGLTPEELQGIQQFRASRTKEEADLAALRFESLAGIAAGLAQIPDPNRRLEEARRRAPMFGISPDQITPEMLTDDGLRAIVIKSMGYKEYLSMQRPQATQFGFVSGIDPVTQQPIPMNTGQQPAPQNETVLDALPPGASIRPRPNQAPSTGGAERNQTPTVSFGSVDEARTHIGRLVPGVTFTSGVRSPQHNAAVGGVRTSNHLRGRAWDLVPPAGMSMAQLAARMKQAGFRVLNEGDHVHVSW